MSASNLKEGTPLAKEKKGGKLARPCREEISVARSKLQGEGRMAHCHGTLTKKGANGFEKEKGVILELKDPGLQKGPWLKTD